MTDIEFTATLGWPECLQPPFEIGDELTMFEAAMLYAGRHPGGYWLNGKTKNAAEDFDRAELPLYERFLCPEREREARDGTPRKLSWDVYCELRRRGRSGEIKPIKTAYLPNGDIDPRDTTIKTSDLAALAIERDERPDLFAHLIDDLLSAAEDEKKNKEPIKALEPADARDGGKSIRQQRCGAPPKYDWVMIHDEMLRLMNENGDFDRSDPKSGWNAQMRLEEKLKSYCEGRFDAEPATSLLRPRITRWLAEWRKQNEKEGE